MMGGFELNALRCSGSLVSYKGLCFSPFWRRAASPVLCVILSVCLTAGCNQPVDGDRDGYQGVDTLKGSPLYDCDDHDPLIGPGLAYYRDADADGLGDERSPCYFCPGEYETLDPDSPNEAPVSTDEVQAGPEHVRCEADATYVRNDWDCDDADGAGLAWVTYYRDADGDALGDPDLEVAERRCPGDLPLPENVADNPCDCDDSEPTTPPPQAGADWEGMAKLYYLEADSEANDPTLFNVIMSCFDPGSLYVAADYACNEYSEVLLGPPAESE